MALTESPRAADAPGLHAASHEAAAPPGASPEPAALQALRASTAAARGEARIVHLVGRLTEVVFSFLGPATAALAAAGFRQTVVVMEHPACPYLVHEFDPAVEVVLIRHDTRWRRWRAAFPVFLRALGQRPAAVHFHGYLPLLAGGLLMRFARLDAARFYSPHGSRAHRPAGGLRDLLLAAAAWLVGGQRLSGITDVTDAGPPSLSGFSRIDMLPSPVDDAFFTTRHVEHPLPTVVAASPIRGVAGALVTAQVAAVFSGVGGAPSFRWLGTPHSEEAARALKAAGVAVTAEPGVSDRVALLARAHVFMAPAESRGFPVHLAEAMALGLPCLAVDCDSHRALIEHQVNGLLFSTVPEAQRFLARLVDDADLRHRLGGAAGASARRRHQLGQFNESILEIYRDTTSPSL